MIARRGPKINWVYAGHLIKLTSFSFQGSEEVEADKRW